MLLQWCTVSRKTPRDGRLEITDRSARALAALPMPLRVRWRDATGDGALDSMECGCRGSEHRHVHWFIRSELLKALAPESRVQVDYDADGTIAIDLTTPGLSK